MPSSPRTTLAATSALTKDSYPPDLLAPLTQNPYQYCGNNPVNRVDLEGTDPAIVDVKWHTLGSIRDVRNEVDRVRKAQGDSGVVDGAFILGGAAVGAAVGIPVGGVAGAALGFLVGVTTTVGLKLVQMLTGTFGNYFLSTSFGGLDALKGLVTVMGNVKGAKTVSTVVTTKSDGSTGLWAVVTGENGVVLCWEYWVDGGWEWHDEGPTPS